jgi:glycine/serine hydroxymethyltransferase
MSNTAPSWLEPGTLAFRQQVLEHVDKLSSLELAAPRVTALPGTMVATRAGEGHSSAKHHTGSHWVEEIEAMASELIARLFDARHT